MGSHNHIFILTQKSKYIIKQPSKQATKRKQKKVKTKSKNYVLITLLYSIESYKLIFISKLN